MPRVNKVARARNKQPNCGKCGKKIKAGDAYTWWANRIGRSSMRRVRCSSPSCQPRPSDLTTSDKLSQIYAAQEELDDTIGTATTVQDIIQALETAAEQAREVADMYQESIDNMPENLQQSSTADEITEKVDACNNWADELESVMGDLESELEEIIAGDEESITTSPGDRTLKESPAPKTGDPKLLEDAKNRATDVAQELMI